jgi:outer membrane protein assembly factor BamB
MHPVVQWTTPISSSPDEPLLADGVIYVGDVQGTLYAIKLTDGSILWQFASRAQIFAAPAKRGGTIQSASRRSGAHHGAGVRRERGALERRAPENR